MNIIFDDCQHDWKFHIDVDKAGGPATGNTVFLCSRCKHLITLREKSTLDTVELTKESLRGQEKSLENAKIATYIAAGAMVLTAIIYILDKISS